MRAVSLGERLWTPSAPERTRMATFRRAAAERAGTSLPDYAALHGWSLERPASFWRLVWERTGIVGTPGEPVLEHGDAMPGARWFPDARLSYPENLLRFEGAETAVVWRDEQGHRASLSRDELRRRVAAAAEALRALGLERGDRVAAIVPNRIETLVLMLAATSIGAVWSSCSPDFGARAALDRFAQIAPRLLVGCDGYGYGGRRYETLGRLAEIRDGLPEVRATLVIPVLDAAPDLSGIPDARRLADALPSEAPAAPAFERVPFDAPLYVMFSSGTTGRPKCIVHGHGGTLLQQAKEHALHCDLGPGDALLFFTTTGWMMWNWLVTALARGTTVALYDGSPMWPDPGVLPRYVEEEGLTALGVSPGWVTQLEKADYHPATHHDLSSLRLVLSTGSPLSPEGFAFVYDALAPDVLLASITGGTDIMGCFALGCPELPVHAGEIQCIGLGMAVDFYDAEGNFAADGRGELVCTRPFPSMPVGFWNDPDGSRYRGAYFETFPGVWHHGDFGELTPRGGIVIHGRSDATLNRGGVRIGTAEIYRQVEQIPEVQESLAIAVDRDGRAGSQEVWLFVRLQDAPAPGDARAAALDEALEQRIRHAIREGASPRHVPDRLLAVPDLPRTRSGKLTELAVRDVVHGREVSNVGALANPEALEAFRGLAVNSGSE